jgi:hypothetical protein
LHKSASARELCWASWTSNLEGGVSSAEPHSRCREARSLPVIQVGVTKGAFRYDGIQVRVYKLVVVFSATVTSKHMVVVLELPM